MKPPFHKRRDLLFLVLMVPLGIPLMLVAGQFATRLPPIWQIPADISSNVDPSEYFGLNELPDSIAPVRPDILTPMSWADSFLTPQATITETGIVPLVVLDPSATPTNTPVVSSTPSPSATPPAVTTTSSLPSTTPPPVSPTVTSKPPKDLEDPPVVTASPTTNPTASPTLPPVTSTIDPALTQLTPAPPGLNMGEPDGTNASGSNFPDGSYVVLDVSSNPIVVNATPDGHYDLVFYEDENPNGSNQISMDQVILGISNDPSGNTYYQIFNWGNGIPDTNSNVNTTTLGLPAAEIDNQTISTDDLYEDPSAIPPPSNPQTGILIDVDQAPSHPPPGTYDYLVIIAPPDTNPNNAGDDGQVDSVQVTDVVSPVPP